MRVHQLCIIIPTYNRAELALEATQSCLEQTLPPGWGLQVVIVDDGSTDDTLQRFISHYAMKPGRKGFYESVRVSIRKIPNSERGAARNAGASFALSEIGADWLLFLDADDVLAPGSLLKILPRFSSEAKTAAQIVSTKFLLWDGRKTFGLPQPPTPRQARVTDAFLRQSPLALGTTLVHRSVFRAIGGFSENREMSGSEDWLFLFRASLGAQVQFQEEVLVHYRRHSQNTAPERTERAMALALHEMRPFLLQHYGGRGDWAYRQLKKNQELMLVGAYNSSGASRKAFSLICEFAGHYPEAWFSLRLWRTFLSVLTKKFAL